MSFVGRHLVASMLLSVCFSSFARFNGLNEAICRDQAQFVDCLGWTVEQCLTKANEALTICLRIMATNPGPPSTIEEEIDNPFGSGAWGVAFGICGELAMYQLNEDRVKEDCRGYFNSRVRDEPPNFKFVAALTKAVNYEKKSTRNALLQMVMIVVPGLLVPLVISFWRWKNHPPHKFFVGFSFLLILPSLLGAAGGFVV